MDEDTPTQVLAGAVFKLQKETSPGVYEDVDPQTANLTTGADGKIRLSRDDVELDVNYQLVEITAPTGYELDNVTKIQFKIKTDQTQLEEKSMTNKVLKNGSVKLIKKDKHTEQRLAGAQFSLEYNQGGTGNWVEVEVNKIYTTDGNGEFEVTNLNGGEYRFVEVTPPTGYESDSTPLVFEITEETKNPLVTFENEASPRSITLTKKGINDETLAGAEFTLQYGSGEKDKDGHDLAGQRAKDIDGNDIPNQTTDHNGELSFDNLRPGKYQLVEIKAPKGYKLDSRPNPVEIDQATIVKTIDITNSLVDDGSITIFKLDEDDHGLRLAGAIFEIIDLATNETAKDKDDNLLVNLKTDADGKFTVSNLKTGKYRIMETKAPEGYHLGKQTFDFEIVSEKQTIDPFFFYNKIITGSVKLTKISSGNPKLTLKGAEFKLLDENNIEIRTGLVTDDNGELVVDDLRPGAYKFVETKAPSGYYLSNEPIEFTIEKEQTTEVTAENRRRSSGGGGGGGGSYDPDPPEKDKKPEEEKKPTDPKTPEEEQPLDPKESEEPKTTEDPETPTDQGQPGQGVGQDQQETDHSTGNLSDNASENLPTAQDNQMNKDNRNLADSDKASANKKLLPQTGESLPFTPLLGLLLIIAAALLLFRKESVQNK